MERKNLASLYTQSFRDNWDLPLFSDYEGETFCYKDVALSIQTIKSVFSNVGIAKGDKIAIYGRNSSNWGKIFLACASYGVIAVPILPDFKPDNVHNIVNHSGAMFLFAARSLYSTLNIDEMPRLKGVIAIEDFAILKAIDENLQNFTSQGLNLMKDGHIDREAFEFEPVDSDEMMILSYTSGSSGFSKGVMIPVRSVFSNVIFAQDHMPLKSGDKIVSFLPMAHVFGLLFEYLFPVSVGCHITFLNKMPSPQVLIKSFQQIKPRLILSVPLVIEKIYKKSLLPTIQKPAIKIMLGIPGINKLLHKKINAKLIETFGGNFHEIVIGGAALSSEVETFFRKIGFQFTIGYGMTECGPLISYAPWNETQPLSAGKLVDRMEIRIDSEDPYKIVGEIQVKGDNVMLGYFNNDEANKNTFTEDGWLRTGDLGIIDHNNFVYIKGRSKNMLLGPSGQNIYPEELEARLSNLPYVAECVVVQRENKLVALVFPDKDGMRTNNIDENALNTIMADNRKNFNHHVAQYEQLSKIEIVNEEFEKTPKKNIKRFLYS